MKLPSVCCRNNRPGCPCAPQIKISSRPSLLMSALAIRGQLYEIIFGISGCTLKSFVSGETWVYGNEVAEGEKTSLGFPVFTGSFPPDGWLILLTLLIFTFVS